MNSALARLGMQLPDTSTLHQFRLRMLAFRSLGIYDISRTIIHRRTIRSLNYINSQGRQDITKPLTLIVRWSAPGSFPSTSSHYIYRFHFCHNNFIAPTRNFQDDNAPSPRQPGEWNFAEENGVEEYTKNFITLWCFRYILVSEMAGGRNSRFG